MRGPGDATSEVPLLLGLAPIVQFVDDHCAEFGVESACGALQAARSTYWTAKRQPLSRGRCEMLG